MNKNMTLVYMVSRNLCIVVFFGESSLSIGRVNMFPIMYPVMKSSLWVVPTSLQL